jgi:uncharacterized delta-60 repeat protein
VALALTLGAPAPADAAFDKTTTDFGRVAVANAATLQPDGKIVAVGRVGDARTGDFALARYYPNGTIDRGFGTGGTVTTPFTPLEDAARAVAILPDGKIVVGGFAGSEAIGDFALVRYRPDGMLDPTFGTAGKVTTDLSGGLADAIRGMAVLHDGKILAAGPAGSRIGLARYNADGSLDPSFGRGGKRVVALGGAAAHVFALAPLRDGSFVLAGAAVRGVVLKFLLARFRADGSLDGSFADRGIAITDFSGLNDIAYAVAVQPDGKILLAGSSGSFDPIDATGDTRIAVARYTSAGRLDPSFGAGGKAQIDASPGADGARGVFVEPDGTIVLGGFVDEAHGVQSVLDPLIGDFGVVELRPDGSVTPGGLVRTDFAGAGDGARAVIAAADGRFLLAGGATVGHLDFGLAEYARAHPRFIARR